MSKIQFFIGDLFVRPLSIANVGTMAIEDGLGVAASLAARALLHQVCHLERPGPDPRLFVPEIQASLDRLQPRVRIRGLGGACGLVTEVKKTTPAEERREIVSRLRASHRCCVGGMV